MGWENKFHCEKEPFPQSILKYYWPNAQLYEDITKSDFTFWRGKIDVLTGGFPCQPYSVAGKQLGKEDDRHLWPEMLRAIREIQPRWVVGENVRGLVNWNAGLVFNEVQVDLEAEGYELQTFLLPAAGVGAPHERYRIWFVAFNANHEGSSSGFGTIQKANGKISKRNNNAKSCNPSDEIITNAKSKRGCSRFREKINHNIRRENSQYIAQRSEVWNRNSTISRTRISTHSDSRRQPSKEYRKKGSGFFTEESIFGNWENFPTQSPICGGNDGLPTELDGITFPKWRNESIKGYGNAIVPQVALQIFKAIEQYEKQTQP